MVLILTYLQNYPKKAMKNSTFLQLKLFLSFFLLMLLFQIKNVFIQKDDGENKESKSLKLPQVLLIMFLCSTYFVTSNADFV